MQKSFAFALACLVSVTLAEQSPELVQADVQEVVEQNQQYNEVKTEIIQQEEKQLFPQEKLLSQEMLIS